MYIYSAQLGVEDIFIIRSYFKINNELPKKLSSFYDMY